MKAPGYRGSRPTERARIEGLARQLSENDVRGRRPNQYEHEVSEEDSFWGKVARLASVKPVMGDPSLDPANEMIQVSRMAGYGDGAFDSIQGVGRLVTGQTEEPPGLDLRAESATPGAPLELGPHESAFDDRAGLGTHSLRVEGGGDWCRELRR